MPRVVGWLDVGWRRVSKPETFKFPWWCTFQDGRRLQWLFGLKREQDPWSWSTNLDPRSWLLLFSTRNSSVKMEWGQGVAGLIIWVKRGKSWSCRRRSQVWEEGVRLVFYRSAHSKKTSSVDSYLQNPKMCSTNSLLHLKNIAILLCINKCAGWQLAFMRQCDLPAHQLFPMSQIETPP